MTPACIYHRVDLDGQCSAAIVRQKYPDVELVPYQYGDELDLERFRGRRVIMVDVSLQPFDRMRQFAKTCELVWIDHHATALEDHKKDPARIVDGLLSDDEKAGCELTWLWTHPGEQMPRAVFLLGRYDVWDLEADTDVLPFQYGMRSYSTDPTWPLWPHLLTGNAAWCHTIVDEGATIIRYAKQQATAACGSAFDAEIEGLRCICLNMPRTGSQVFESVWDPGQYDAMCSFYNHQNQGWTVSLYTDREDIDVGAIAKAHGGGGHRGAAGWSVEKLPDALMP